MLSTLKCRSLARYRERAIVCLLMALAFAVRVHRVDFNSLSEDESAKWAAVQEYRHGHFAGVNSEHPMLPKVLSWASLTIGERWSGIAAGHGWPSLRPEGWLRMPNVLLGAGAAAVLFLLCRRIMGLAGSFAAGFFWAVAPLPIALNRLTKEETPLTCFTLLACYFYCRAQQSRADQSARRWFDLSAIGFGLALASQYILHLFGLNALAWLLAGRFGLVRQPSRFEYKRFYLILFLTFVLVNPVVLSPSNFSAILHWLHHDGVRHTGYDFDGTLYLNFPGRLLAGVPWFYYLWLIFVKTPIPILLAVVVGIALLLRNRRTLASCFFLSFGMVQFIGLSVSGAKWIRYSLPMLPFFFLAGGYAIQQIWNRVKGKNLAPLAFAAGTAILIGWPLLELQSWMPYYSFYLNAMGGGKQNITRYFAPDEVSEFDTREVAQEVCQFDSAATRVATARPMSMGHYFETCGRADIQVVPLYDPQYVPREGDLIVLEPSRRFFETQRFFDTLGRSRASRSDIHVGPVCASTIYRFDTSVPEPGNGQQHVAVNQFLGGQPPLDGNTQQSVSTQVSKLPFSDLARRLIQ